MLVAEMSREGLELLCMGLFLCFGRRGCPLEPGSFQSLRPRLRGAGVEFIPGEDSKGPGLRLKQAGEGASRGKSMRRKR
jgi:hypothetical protein